MTTDIQLGEVNFDGLSGGRSYTAGGYVGGISAGYRGGLHVGYRHPGHEEYSWVNMGVADPDVALGSVLEEDAAIHAITDVLQAVRQHEAGIVIAGVPMTFSGEYPTAA